MVGRLMFTMDVSSVAIKIPIARIASTAHLLACSCPSSLLEIASLFLVESTLLFSCTLELSLERLWFTSSVSFCCISILFGKLHYQIFHTYRFYMIQAITSNTPN